MAGTSKDKGPRASQAERAGSRRARVSSRSPPRIEFGSLTEAERILLAASAHGSVARLDGEALIRASVLRFLILGGDDEAPVHPTGVRLAVARIEGHLDLSSCTVLIPVHLVDCRFDEGFSCNHAEFAGLVLSGSRFSFVNADRIRSSGEIRLDHVIVERGLSLTRAKIDGDLNLLGAKLGFEDTKYLAALSLDEAQINGSVFLGQHFSAGAQVSMRDVEIAGGLVIERATIDSRLYAANATVRGDFVLHTAEITGGIVLTDARVSRLCDQASSWRPPLFLSGFDYQRIADRSIDVPARIAWLQMQQQFDRQPWEQLFRVLRGMGHAGEATLIAIAKQQELRRLGLIGDRPISGVSLPVRWRNSLLNSVERAAHWAYGAVAGYGHRKFQGAFIAVLVFWLAAGLAFTIGRGYFGPSNSSLIEHRNEWGCGYSGEPGKVAWTECRRIPPEYARFQPLMYSADIILPFLDLQQEAAWAPIVSDAAGNPLLQGRLLRALMWLEILFGWAAVGYLVSLIGKLASKDPEG